MITLFQAFRRQKGPKTLKVGVLKGSDPEHPMTGTVSFEKTDGSLKLIFKDFRSVPGDQAKVFLGKNHPLQPESLLGYLPKTHGDFELKLSLNTRLESDSRVVIRTGRNQEMIGYAELKKPLQVIRQS